MSEWKEYKLKDLTTKIGSGATPTGGGNAYKVKGISLIRSQNVLDFKFSYNGLAFIDDEQANDLRNVIVNKNDVLLNITGDSVARVCKVPNEVLPARVNQHVAIIRADETETNSDFLLYYLQSIKEYLLSISEIGGTRNALTKSMIEGLDLIIPSPSDQIQIASVLSSLDDKIDLLHRQNKTLEQLSETLFRQWFVVEAEESWKVGKLGDVISIYDSKRIPVSSMERAKMKTGELYPYYGAATIMDYINQYIFDGEYILMGEDGTVQTEKGFPILQMPTGKFWVNNHTHIFQANQPFSNYFIYIFLKRTNISGIVTGAVQPKINQEALKRIQFVIPPKEKIKEFAETEEQFWQKIKSNQNQIRILTLLRDTLLPKLMSGEVMLKAEKI